MSEEYNKELELVNEKTKLEIEAEKERQVTLKEQVRLERIKSRKETSIKKFIAKLIASILLINISVVAFTFIVALFLPENVKKAIQIIKSIV
jgi:hypothetical protein